MRYAAQEKIPLERLELSPGEQRNSVGDTVVALVSLSQTGRVRQWLLQLTIVEPTPEEQKLPPADAETWHTSVGAKITFEGARLAVAFRLIGPVRAGDRMDAAKPPPDHRARALVRAGFLRLGFDRGAATMQRLDAMHDQAAEFNLGISNEPFAAEIVARNKPIAERVGLTLEDERAMVGVVPALLAFFDVVIKTPGLKEIFFEMLDKLALGWSVVTHGGKMEPSFGFSSEGIAPIDTERWGTKLPPTYGLTVPFALNGKPALICRFVATRPDPPLVACAGLIGLHATSPRDARRELAIRVLAARRGLAPREN